MNMDLQEIRKQIDSIDQELVDLFCRRMNLSALVADYKKDHDLPIYVPAREQEILQSVAKRADPQWEESVQMLYSTIFQLSRDYQNKRNQTEE